MTSDLVQRAVFRQHPFSLVDVGVSGGIDDYWNVFRDDLIVVGFDPLGDEIRPLKASAPARHRYFALAVGQKHSSLTQNVPDADLFSRTSAARAAQLTERDRQRLQVDRTGCEPPTQEPVELDRFFLKDHPMDIDFLKIDTDGSDLQVLRGAEKVLKERLVLGLGVECFFCGPIDEDSSTFRNIDWFLAASGFTLFDLEIHRYSRSALPSPFLYRIFAQTCKGQIRWADALYLRDAASDDDRAKPLPFKPIKVIKLACIFEIFGLEDCAAELLLKHRGALEKHIDVDRCLDLLTPARNGRRLSYAEYIQTFEKDPTTFYPSA